MIITITKLLRIARMLAISFAIGTVIGYFTFYMTMPSVVVPNTTNPSLPIIGLILFGIGLLVGLLSESLEILTIEILLGTILGVFMGWFLFVSPSLRTDIVISDPASYIYSVLHSALPLLVLGLIVLFISGFIGNMIMEGMEIKAVPSPFAEEEGKKPLEERK